MTIYLDNAAATPVRKEVVEAMMPYFSTSYGNPGSVHSLGKQAKEAVEDARERVAKILGCLSEEIIFTSGGTESINLALQGIARDAGHIITTKSEHPAVLETCTFLQTEGCTITYLDVDTQGLVDPKELESAITPGTILISIIYANNEVGTVQDIKSLAAIAKKHDIPFHTDACQAGLLNIKDLGVTLMTLNGSKIYGPKGAGILYAKGVDLQPLVFGGKQEQGLRSGTENVPAIVGFAKALELLDQTKDSEVKRLTFLRDTLIHGLLEIKGSRLNGHATKRLPNNVNISFRKIEGESLVLHLNEEGIFASTGSACSSTKLEASHVLEAMQVEKDYIHGSIRFSLGKDTTTEDISQVIKTVTKIVAVLRQVSPIKA